MGNLCSSGSEKVDNKQEKLLPEKLKDGEGEALLPKFGAGVGLVTGEGSVDGSARVGSADVTSKVLENGLCVMPGGRSVCPEIVVSSSDVEPVEEDDDDDFLNSVIAVVGDAAGRAITTAQDVVAEIEARNLPQSDDAVVSFAEATPHRDGGVRDSVGVDHAAPGNSSRQSVGAESANWADSVLMSATTAAQSAFDSPSFASSDFTSDFTRKEDSPSSVLGENSNNIVAMSSTVGDKVDELAVTGNSVEIGQVSGENSQPATDTVSGIPICAEHRVESGPSNSHDVNHGTAGSSGSQINGGDGSSVDIFVAEVEGCLNRVALEASGHQTFSDQSWAGRTKTASSGHETAAHVDGLGTSVDARVNFRETSQQEDDLNNKDEENTQGKEFRCDVPSTLGAAVGQPASQVSGPLEKTAGPCAGAAGKSTVSAFVKDDMDVDSSESLEGTGGAHFCPPSLSPHTHEAEMGILDKGTPLPEDDIFSGWSVVSDTDFLKHANSDDDLSYEAAARDIVESIITRASSVVSGSEVEKGLEDFALSFVDREESIFADQGPDALLPFLTDRFASPPELSPSETDQCQPAGADSSTSSISQGDLIEREELLIPPVSPLNVLGESRGSLIFDSSSEDIDYASIKQTAWSITDMAVQEAIKIVANGYDLDEHINQAHNNDLVVVYPCVDSSVHDECYSKLSETCLNKTTESPTHMNGANCLPEYSTQTGLTSDQQQSARPEITPAEETPAHPTSHTNKPLENDLMDILDNSSHASPVIPSDTEFISSSSPPTSNGEHGDSDSNTATSTLYFSKVPSCLPALDNDSLPGKPVIIINSPDSPADTGSNEDISVHTEALI
ncbi:hypothetical protein BsWGS_28576 [Bradybaena similaris]